MKFLSKFRIENGSKKPGWNFPKMFGHAKRSLSFQIMHVRKTKIYLRDHFQLKIIKIFNILIIPVIAVIS